MNPSPPLDVTVQILRDFQILSLAFHYQLIFFPFFVSPRESIFSLFHRHFKVVISGPESSPYEGGKFKLELFLPGEYPMVPPKVCILGEATKTEQKKKNVQFVLPRCNTTIHKGLYILRSGVAHPKSVIKQRYTHRCAS